MVAVFKLGNERRYPARTVTPFKPKNHAPKVPDRNPDWAANDGYTALTELG
jgi:hypothetical protein